MSIRGGLAVKSYFSCLWVWKCSSAWPVGRGWGRKDFDGWAVPSWVKNLNFPSFHGKPWVKSMSWLKRKCLLTNTFPKSCLLPCYLVVTPRVWALGCLSGTLHPTHHLSRVWTRGMAGVPAPKSAHMVYIDRYWQLHFLGVPPDKQITGYQARLVLEGATRFGGTHVWIFKPSSNQLWMDLIYWYVPLFGLVSFWSRIALPPAPSIVGDCHEAAESQQ